MRRGNVKQSADVTNVSPRRRRAGGNTPEGQSAVLVIKGEVGDLDGTRAAVDGRGQPVDPARVADQHVGVVRHAKVSINAAEKEDRRRRVTLASVNKHGCAVVLFCSRLTCFPGRCPAATRCDRGHGLH